MPINEPPLVNLTTLRATECGAQRIRLTRLFTHIITALNKFSVLVCRRRCGTFHPRKRGKDIGEIPKNHPNEQNGSGHNCYPSTKVHRIHRTEPFNVRFPDACMACSCLTSAPPQTPLSTDCPPLERPATNAIGPGESGGHLRNPCPTPPPSVGMCLVQDSLQQQAVKEVS